jgi:predicted membrane protein DUF2306
MTIGMRYWRWGTFALSVWFSLMAARFFFLPLTEAASEPFGRHLAGHGLTFYLHAGGGAVALMTGALQWLLTAGSRRSRWHRLIGRTYVVAIAVGGLAGLAIATRAFGGIVARAGFSTLAVVWLASTMVAWTRARAQDWTMHRAWMVRSFALTFAAVTLRVWLPLLVTAGLSFEVAYRVVAWWSWLPNLVVAEWLIAGGQRIGAFRVRDVIFRAGGPAL